MKIDDLVSLIEQSIMDDPAYNLGDYTTKFMEDFSMYDQEEE